MTHSLKISTAITILMLPGLKILSVLTDPITSSSETASLMETTLLRAFASCLKDLRKEPLEVLSKMSRLDIARAASQATHKKTLCKGIISVLNLSARVTSLSEEVKITSIFGPLETMKSTKCMPKIFKFMNPTTMSPAVKMKVASIGKPMMEFSLSLTSPSSRNIRLAIHLLLNFLGIIADSKHQISTAANSKKKKLAILLADPMLTSQMNGSVTQVLDLATDLDPYIEKFKCLVLQAT